VVDSSTTQKTTALAVKTYATQAISANLGAYQTWANVNLGGGGGGTTYSNANVASYLPTYSGNVLAANIIQTATGQITTPVGSNGNLTLNPDGTGWVVVTNITPVLLGNTLQVRDVRDTVYTIASGSGTTTGTITPDAANGDMQVLTLTGSITLNAFNNPQSGQTVTFAVVQPNGTGPYTLTSSMKFAGGNKTLSTAANAVDLLTVTYVNSTIGYLASLVTGFA
jgi:cold shock CspA family protein